MIQIQEEWRHFYQKNYAVLHRTGFKEVILKDSIFHLFHLNTDLEEKINIDDKKRSADLEQQRKKWEATTIPPAFYGLNQEEIYEREKKMKQKQ